MRLARWSLLFLGLAVPAVPKLADAKLLQIIHTNDLHSHMEQSAADIGVGGFAAVRSQIDILKARANAQGIETLTLDAGDFSEGSEFFFADEGRQSWRAVNAMGYDAIALGNHDYQVGTPQMNEILGSVFPTFALLCANYEFDKKFANVAKYLGASLETVKSGMKLAVIGLTTNELVYRWAAKPGGKVGDPIKSASKLAQTLKKRNDHLIALTHIGLAKDIDLVKGVPELDIVVGGHSHTEIHQPVFVPTPLGKRVPVVQAGEHGRFVGDLLVDLEPGKEARVINYKLHPVSPSASGEDALMKDVVRQSRDLLERKYGAAWLYESIGETKVPMSRPYSAPSRWGQIFAQAYRESSGADLGLDVGEFFGPTQPAGPITREKLIQFYPRTFDTKKPYGWNVWTIEAHGAAIREAVTQVYKRGKYFALDNVTFDVVVENGKTKLKNFRIGGKKLDPKKRYRIATSEGLGFAGKRINWFLKQYFNPKDTGAPIWTAVENKIQAMGGVIDDLPEPSGLR